MKRVGQINKSSNSFSLNSVGREGSFPLLYYDFIIPTKMTAGISLEFINIILKIWAICSSKLY